MKHEEEEGSYFFDRAEETVADVFVKGSLGKNKLLPRKREGGVVVMVVRRWRGEKGLGWKKLRKPFASRLPSASPR